MVPAPWWCSWCDFVNIESKPYQELTNKDQKITSFKTNSSTSIVFKDKENSTLPVAETERRTIPIGGIEHSSTKNLLLKMKASEEEFYSRPSKIKNLSLIRLKTNELNEKVFQIKHDIQNMYDYVKVDRECWEYFKAWYGYDYEIKIENNFEFVDDNSFDSLDSI